MLDKAAGALAIIGILLAAVSLGFVFNLNSSVDQLRSQQRTVETSIGTELSQVRSDLAGLRGPLQEAQKIAEEKKAEEELLTAAQREAAAGPLLIYGAMDAPDIVNIVWPAFKAKYPFVGNIQYIEGFSPLSQRFIEEAARGVRTADLRIEGAATAYSEYLAGLSGPFKTQYDSQYEPGQIIDERLHSAFSVYFVIAYNTNLVSKDSAPKAWADLADPKWQGKLSAGNPVLEATCQNVFADLLKAFGEEKLKGIARGMLVQNKALISDCGTGTYTHVLTGDAHVGIILINDVVQQKAGTPVAVIAPSEGPTTLGAFIYMYKNTQKPNLAKLFAEWFLSPEGQHIVAVTGRQPALLSVEGSQSKLLNDSGFAGFKLIPANTDNFADPEKVRLNFERIFKEIGVPT